MGAMHGASSGFLSVSMPNTFSMGWNYVEKYIREKNLECPDRDVFEVLENRVKRYLKKGYLAANSVYVSTEHTERIINDYFEALAPIFSVISECENGQNIDDLLEGPICHSGFKRLN